MKEHEQPEKTRLAGKHDSLNRRKVFIETYEASKEMWLLWAGVGLGLGSEAAAAWIGNVRNQDEREQKQRQVRQGQQQESLRKVEQLTLHGILKKAVDRMVTDPHVIEIIQTNVNQGKIEQAYQRDAWLALNPSQQDNLSVVLCSNWSEDKDKTIMGSIRVVWMDTKTRRMQKIEFLRQGTQGIYVNSRDNSDTKNIAAWMNGTDLLNYDWRVGPEDQTIALSELNKKLKIVASAPVNEALTQKIIATDRAQNQYPRRDYGDGYQASTTVLGNFDSGFNTLVKSFMQAA